MKLMSKKFKKVALPFMLTGTLLLTACGKQEDKAVVVEPTTQISTEELTTEEVLATQTTEAVYNENDDTYALAATSYNNYTKFYSETGLAFADENANQGINIEKIENMIKVIKGDVSDLTESQIDDACESINYVLLSQNLSTQLHNVIDEELGYITIEGQINLSEAPSLVEYATDAETIEVLTNYETLRNKVQNDLNTTNKVSDETKQELKNAVIDMEYDYLPDENDMNGDVNAEGNKLLENYVKKNLVDLTVLATNESRLETEVFPGGLKIAPETDQERDVQSKALIHGLDILTDSEKELYSTMTMELVGTKYLDGICTHQENIKRHAKDNVDTYSKIDTLKQYKEYLSNINKENEYTLSM
ncbi:MAG: hypothetical protein IJ105_05950 [Bacilli bacterium]|nr:hypothetical protein [Bacilli bacterium]